MKRQQTLYGYDTVTNYINRLKKDNPNLEIVEIYGSLVDEFYINHGHCLEVFEEVYISERSSGLARHVYRKRVPERIRARLENTLSNNWSGTLSNFFENYCIKEAIKLIDNFNNK